MNKDRHIFKQKTKGVDYYRLFLKTGWFRRSWLASGTLEYCLKVAGGPEMALKQAYRALDAIDRLVSCDWCEELEMRTIHEELTGDHLIMHQKLSLIYQIAHSESPSHSCYEFHDEWRKTKDAILNPNQGTNVSKASEADSVSDSNGKV